MKTPTISCFIFAGGKNSRMGTHKAFLTIGGRRMIDVQIDALSGLFHNVNIITNDRRLFADLEHSKVFEDIIMDKGPMGAMYTALQYAQNEQIFCYPCDMPVVDKTLIERLMNRAAEGPFDCVIPLGPHGPEPLVGIYHTRLRDKARHEIREGNLKVSDFIKQCNTAYIDCKAVQENLNRPDEYRAFVANMPLAV